jgi:hypothetical protein
LIIGNSSRGRRGEFTVPNAQQHAAVAIEAIGVSVGPRLEPHGLSPGAAFGGVPAKS